MKKNNLPSNIDYDVDNDGTFDSVQFIIPRHHGMYENGEDNIPNFLWTHKSDITNRINPYYDVNGKQLKLRTHYLFPLSDFGSDYDRYGIIAQEFLHSISYPYYYYEKKDVTYYDMIGKWSVMGYKENNIYPTVYERIKYGKWIDDKTVKDISKDGEYTVYNSQKDSDSYTISYKIPSKKDGEYFMVEYRNKSGYDSNISESGIIVYRIVEGRNGNYKYSSEPEMVVLSNRNNWYSSLNGKYNQKELKLIQEDGTDTGIIVSYVDSTSDNAKFSISGLSSTPISYTGLSVSKNVLNIGESVNIQSYASGGSGVLKYKFAYILNGQETIIRDYNTNSTCTWTPSKLGTYTIKGYVTDGNITKEKIEDCVEVKEVEKKETKATIYYNKKSNLTGSNVYIHYNKNGQGWTNVPGERMTSTDEKSGYNYKFTIDLNNEYGKLVFCFNDGNNHWDSRNAGNYECTTGTYGVSNESTRKLESNFAINSLTTTFDQCTVLGNIGVTATTSNGNGTVNYRFTAIDSSNEETVIKDYSSEGSASWKPEKVGTYTLKVQARDESNKVLSKTKTINVVNMATVTGTFDKQSPQDFGSTVKVTLNAQGGTGNLQYQLIAQGGNYEYGSKEIYVQKYSTNKEINWTPDMDGTYTLLVDVKDATGAINRVSLGNYTFNKNLLVSSFTSNKQSPQIAKTAVTLTATAKNETGNVQYSFSYQKKGGAVTDILANSQLNTCTWMPEEAGEYTLFVDIKDASGNTASKSITFTVVNPIKITSFTSDKKSPQVANTTINFNTEVTGGIGTVQYRYTLVSENGNKTVIRDYSSNSSFAWTPKDTVVGSIMVEAKDESGDSNVSSQMDYSIEKSKDNMVTIYYKSSWDKAYCHYKVNGQWTNVPGKEMTKIAAIDGGYNYKLEINLGTTSNITCCFNNGYGQWDSRNGENYSTSDCTNKSLGVKDQSMREITVGPQTISISSLVATPNELELGSKVEIKATTANSTGKVGYTFTILKDGKEISSNYNEDGVYNYVPVSEGTYTVKVVAEDTINKTTEKTCTFTVRKKTETNKVTIYYKGYNNPNIHYQKPDGYWTSVPGVKMTLASNGYYTITIDIQKATKLVCCFNDGYGNWDSRNGQNYTFNVGTSYFKNGIISSNPF